MTLDLFTERMQAICGPWPDLVRQIQELHFNPVTFGSNIDLDRTRGRDFSCIASILYLIHNHKRVKMTFPGTPQVEKLLAQKDIIPKQTSDDILQTFAILCRLVTDPSLCGCFKSPARVSPVEMIMTGYLVYIKRNDLSLSGLSCVIERMRANVRKRHADVRANGTVAKTIWSYIQKTTTMRGLPTDDLIPAARRIGLDAREADLAEKERARETKSSPKTRKRKLTAQDSDNEPLKKVRKCDTAPVQEQKAKRTGSCVTVNRTTSGSGTATAKKPVVTSKSSTAVDDKRGVKKTSASAAASASSSAKAVVKPKVEPTTQKRRKPANPRRVTSPASPEVARTQSRSPKKSAGRKAVTAVSGPNDRLAALRAAKAEAATTSSSVARAHSAAAQGSSSSASAGPSRPTAPSQSPSTPTTATRPLPSRTLTPQTTLPDVAGAQSSTQRVGTPALNTLPSSEGLWPGPPLPVTNDPLPVPRQNTPSTSASHPNAQASNPNLTAIPPPDPRRPHLALRMTNPEISRSMLSPLTDYTPSPHPASPRLLPADLSLPPYGDLGRRGSSSGPNLNPNPNANGNTGLTPSLSRFNVKQEPGMAGSGRPPLSAHSNSSGSGRSGMSISPALPPKPLPLPTPPDDTSPLGKSSTRAAPIAPRAMAAAQWHDQANQCSMDRDRDWERNRDRDRESQRDRDRDRERDRDRDRGASPPPRRYSDQYVPDRNRERYDPGARSRLSGNGAYGGSARRI